MSEDILERAKKALIDDDMTYEDYDECISLLIAEVERLRSENDGLKELVDCMLLLMHSEVNSYDKLSRLSIKALETVMEAWQVQCENAIAKDARIKALEALEMIREGDAAILRHLITALGGHNPIAADMAMIVPLQNKLMFDVLERHAMMAELMEEEQ